MRKHWASAALAAAVILPSLSSFAQVIQPPLAKEKAGADPQAVPVKEVVLYTSGVGYFEHFGIG